ncbi:MAG: sugar ABC transporter substrate-binding protein [Anaerolineaceae bacterium]|nr:sugar ABC transporter substrate-binding protein [Anaerolineaceae bacterium]
MSHKLLKVFSMLLIVSVLLTACGTAATPVATEAAAATTAPETVVTEAPTVAEAPVDACAAAKQELYSMLPNIALVGIRDDAALTSRAAINKAWPKTPKVAGTLTIGWSEIGMANPWFVAVKDSAIAEAKAKGYTLNFLIADSDATKQSQHIDTFISEGVDAIVIDPVDTTAVILDIQRAVDAGIPVLVIGAAPSGEAPILTTISDNAYQVGYGAGEYVGGTFDKDMPINIGAIPGKLGNTTAESRTGGMVGGVVAARQKALGKFICKEDAILTGYKLWEEAKQNGSSTNADLNVSIVAMGEGGWSQEGGLAAAEPMLTAHGKDINLMIADNEFMCFGILNAVEAAGLTAQIKVGAPSDGTNQALQMIADGKLVSSGSWNGDQQGKHAIDFLEAIFFKGKDPSNLPLGSFFPPLTFTKENAAQYINPDPNALFFAVPEFVFPPSIDELVAAAK